MFAALALCCVAALALTLPKDGHIARRFLAALHPAADTDGYGWYTLMIRQALSGARFIGQGTLEGYAAALPGLAVESDLMLVWLTYRLGFAALAVVTAALAALLYAGFRLTFRQKSLLGRLTELSVMLTLAGQTAVYLSVSLGFPFVGPLSLPLVSYGNTSTVFNMALIGVMLSCFRTGSVVRDAPPRRRGEAQRA